eukprot:COSAG02_NODE_17547_length_996_cov_1.083612_1_plen_138_part_00
MPFVASVTVEIVKNEPTGTESDGRWWMFTGGSNNNETKGISMLYSTSDPRAGAWRLAQLAVPLIYVLRRTFFTLQDCHTPPLNHSPKADHQLRHQPRFSQPIRVLSFLHHLSIFVLTDSTVQLPVGTSYQVQLGIQT